MVMNLLFPMEFLDYEQKCDDTAFWTSIDMQT